MKKLIAILAFVVLGSAFSFASGTWSSGPASGAFTATVLCTPVLTAPGTFDIGNYFANTAGQPAVGSLTWTLSGPSTATYTVGGDYGTNSFLNGDGHTLNVNWDTFDQTGIDCQVTVPITVNASSMDAGATTGATSWTITVSVSATL